MVQLAERLDLAMGTAAPSSDNWNLAGWLAAVIKIDSYSARANLPLTASVGGSESSRAT